MRTGISQIKVKLDVKVATTYWSLTVGGDPLLPYTSRLFYYISIYIYIYIYIYIFFFFFFFLL